MMIIPFWSAKFAKWNQSNYLDMHGSELFNLPFFVWIDVLVSWVNFAFLTEPVMSEEDGFVVRLRGLPWAVTNEDIIKFFGKS